MAFGTFALGIAEFSMMGILTDVAQSMSISIPTAGNLISAYAAGVSVGAPALLLLRRYPLKHTLLLLATLIFIGNCFAALAPGYHTLLAARFISGLPHGAFFGTGAIVATRLVPEGRGAEAIALMVGGMTVANVVGVPGATFISNVMSWRVAFALVALWGAIAFIGIRCWVPDVAPLPDRGFKGQFAFLKSGAPWLIFAGTFFGQGSVYCWYSYVEPIMTQVTGFPTDAMTMIMVIAGLGMVTGGLVGGRLADKFHPAVVSGTLAASMLIVLPLIYLCSGMKVVSVVLMFIATASLFGLGGPLQYLIVRYSKGGEMLGGAGIQIAFNVSNALAAALGGMAIRAGWGLTSPALVGMPLALAGALALWRLHRRYGA